MTAKPYCDNSWRAALLTLYRLQRLADVRTETVGTFIDPDSGVFDLHILAGSTNGKDWTDITTSIGGRTYRRTWNRAYHRRTLPRLWREFRDHLEQPA